MILSLVVESAPKRFLLETDGESNEEKQEIDENAATSGVKGWMDKMNKKMIRDGKEGFGREKRNRKIIKFNLDDIVHQSESLENCRICAVF